MNTLNFVDVYDFVSTIPYIHNNILDKNDGDDISIIAKYDEANEIIKALINIEDYELTSIVDFINPSIELEDTAYNDEYIISITPDNKLFIQPFKDGDGYIQDSSTRIYVLSNCSSKVLLHLESDEVYEVIIGDEECDCENCELYSKPVDSTSSTNYFVNDKAVSKEEYKDAMAKIDTRYQEFRDEMNRWIDLLSW